jgi:amidase
MKLSEYASYDGLGLAQLVTNGEVSARELAACAAEAVTEVNPAINAVVELYRDRIEELDDDALGQGPFRGVPFLIKDVGNLEAGRKCEQGSRLLEGFSPTEDSNLIQLLRDSGVNNIGRTNVPELCIASTTENSLYGDTFNPWRHGYSAGGSSGGAAAAVAAGIVPIAHGSDIGGSIRIPAAHCGVVGLKPSRGRVSYGPQQAERGRGMASNMVQTRTIRDTATMLDCLGLPQPGDPFVIRQPSRPYLDEVTHAEVGEKKNRLRIGFSCSPLMADYDLDPEIVAAVKQTALLLEELGHNVEEATPDYNPIDAITHCPNMWFLGLDQYLDGIANGFNRQLNNDTLDPVTLSMYEYAKSIDPYSLFTAEDYSNRLCRNFGKFFQQYDIWLTPTTARPSESSGLNSQKLTNISVEEFFYLSEGGVQFTVPYNITGGPAISLPLHQTKDGLPIGIQLGTRHGEEELLIRLASELEQAMPWIDRRPDIHSLNVSKN